MSSSLADTSPKPLLSAARRRRSARSRPSRQRRLSATRTHAYPRRRMSVSGTLTAFEGSLAMGVDNERRTAADRSQDDGTRTSTARDRTSTAPIGTGRPPPAPSSQQLVEPSVAELGHDLLDLLGAGTGGDEERVGSVDDGRRRRATAPSRPACPRARRPILQLCTRITRPGSPRTFEPDPSSDGSSAARELKSPTSSSPTESPRTTTTPPLAGDRLGHGVVNRDLLQRWPDLSHDGITLGVSQAAAMVRRPSCRAGRCSARCARGRTSA